MENQKKDVYKEKLENVLRISKDTEVIAQYTCEELKNQSDTINRITDKSLQVSSNIDKSERIVRGMSSFFGRIKNVFSKPKPTEKLPNLPTPQLSKPEEPSKSTENPKNSRKLDVDEEDKMLDEITKSVDNIKIMAQNISVTLDDHNTKLNIITDITDRNNTRLTNLNYKTKKLLL